MLEIQNLKTKIENINNTQCTLENQKSNEEVCEQKEKNSNVVIICNDKELIKNQNIIQMTQMEFLLKNEKERKAFEQICVYKKGIHISKLRKIMQLAGEKAIFFESAQELLSFINAMEDKNENRNDRVYDNFEELENALKNDEYVSKLNKGHRMFLPILSFFRLC